MTTVPVNTSSQELGLPSTPETAARISLGAAGIVVGAGAETEVGCQSVARTQDRSSPGRENPWTVALAN